MRFARSRDLLGRVPLFAGLGRQELEFPATRTDEVSIDAGRTLLLQLDEALVLRFAVGMLDRGPATATVACKSPVRLMVMSHAQSRDAVKVNDEILSRVMFAMAERLRRDELDRKLTP
ncbi:MAG TPA: hypothetical protein VNF26_12215 [Candidatus Baltobacterales bacterium]|nr:hypothetical protein [Candidatus Baltobacterales bacterium]